MAKDEETARQPLPPYVSFKTFAGVIRRFKETTVPDVVDPSVLRTYANSVARQIIAALKYLDLIGEDGKTSSGRLAKLVSAYETAEWQPVLAEVIHETYGPIVGAINLAAATPAQLSVKFREHGAEGEVLQKCMAFFVAAAKSANINLSPHILDRPRARPERGRGRPKKARADGANDDGQTGVATGDTVRFAFPIPGKPAVTMFLPADITDKDWEMVNAMVTAYIKRKEKG